MVTDELDDDDWVSQKVSKNRPDIDSPRPQDRGGVSVSLGQMDAGSMYRLVVKAGQPSSDDGVRYAQVCDLRAAGFDVLKKPNNRNPDHARVECQSDWDHAAAVAFVSCFSKPTWFEEPEGGDDDG